MCIMSALSLSDVELRLKFNLDILSNLEKIPNEYAYRKKKGYLRFRNSFTPFKSVVI